MNDETLTTTICPATLAAKRVAIAQDVINRLTTQQYTAVTGNWVTYGKKPDDLNQSVQESICQKNLECKCCALGALLLGCVVFNNNVNFEDTQGFRSPLDYGDIVEKHFYDKAGLFGLFAEHELELIETAYERGEGYYKESVCISREDREAAIRFGCDYKFNHDRLLAIMRNIIDNDGEFKP